MERNRGYLRMRSGILLLYLTLAAISLTHCDAERSMRLIKGPKHGRILTQKRPQKLRMVFKHFEVFSSLDSSNVEPYRVSSSSPLPPYECLYPPNPPSTGLPTQSPPASLPTPTTQSVPGSPEIQNPPIIIPSPPGSTTSPPSTVPSPAQGNAPGSPETQNPPIILPGPPGSTTSPPSAVPSPTGGSVPGSPDTQSPPIILPGPPGSTTSPPSIVPSPTGGSVPGSPDIQNPPIILPGPPGSTTSPPSPTGGTVPSPTVFEPPVVFPPPSAPPPPYRAAPSGALWCVAKPSVPDPIIQEAMNYACGSGADCDPIQPNGPCFEPDTVFAHASYAFNSFWQNSKAAGGTCDFGGTGMLVSIDPSYDGCDFVYN